MKPQRIEKLIDQMCRELGNFFMSESFHTVVTFDEATNNAIKEHRRERDESQMLVSSSPAPARVVRGNHTV